MGSGSDRWSQIGLFREAGLDDESRCLEWCQARGLIGASRVCSRHRVPCVLRTRSDRKWPSWRCPRGHSVCDTSVLKGSVFEDTRCSLGVSLLLMLSFSRMDSVEAAKGACNFPPLSPPSKATVTLWFQRLRTMVESRTKRLATERKIGGIGHIVQVDEMQLGRRKYHRGRVPNEVWVVGMIDSDKCLRAEICQRRDAETLIDIIERNVAEGSEIHTDSWRGYAPLARRGWVHRTVNHSQEFVAADGTHTQGIESQWRWIRRKFSGGGIHHKDIPGHLAEQIWRRECRKQGKDPFDDLLEMLKIQ